jgi:phage tail-like protein
LQKVVPAIDSTGREEKFSVLGHDFAYFESSSRTLSTGIVMQKPGCECKEVAAQSQHVVYVADHAGKQAFALILDHTDPQHWTVTGQPDFLPMRRWHGRAVVAVNGQVYYDFVDRWVPLHVFTECHYAVRAVLTTSTRFGRLPAMEGPGNIPAGKVATQSKTIPGAPFDSNIPGCTWHRLFLDAQIPQGTEILIRARAADDPDLLLQTGWSQMPSLYLRSGGAELPYYEPWADTQPLPERTGTWELLFQEIYGRYLQLELTIRGTGRSTPAIRALRAWYPRFSYLDNYMPAVYREDPVSSSFLERWLANFEGFYTNLEEKIEHVAELFDPRTTPAETLDWLAGWFWLALDPLWSTERQRFLIGHLDKLYRWRGTVPGIEIAIRLYVDDRLDESLFDFSSLRKSKVRIVERFSTRGAGGYAYATPTSTGVRPFIPLTPEIVQDNAHRFNVLVPEDLNTEQVAMVERIVTREKPAHTEFEIRPYGSFFRVGEARLGLDTQLGESRRFASLLLGDASLAQSYLAASYPFDIADRVVLDRDHLGNLPAL